MKNLLFICLIALTCMFSISCTTIYKVYGIQNKQEAHEYAVAKAYEIVCKYADKKIDQMEDLSEPVKAELKVQIKTIIDDAFAKLDEIYKQKTQEQIESDVRCVIDDALDETNTDTVIEVAPAEEAE